MIDMNKSHSQKEKQRAHRIKHIEYDDNSPPCYGHGENQTFSLQFDDKPPVQYFLVSAPCLKLTEYLVWHFERHPDSRSKAKTVGDEEDIVYHE